MIWEIYSYWNIQELQGVIEAIAMLTGSGDYISLLATAFLFGLAAASFAVLSGSQDLLSGFRWFIVALMLYFVLFVPKTSVALIDRTGTTGAVTVSNVPLSIALFGHISSKLGDWMTTGYETTMTVITPSYALDGIAFQSNGLLFGEKLLIAAENARSENISFRMNMQSFFEKCIYPEFDTGNISITNALNSSDMWSELSNVNPSLYVQLYNTDGSPTPTPIACDVAYNTVLPAIITNASSEVISRMSGKIYPDKTQVVAEAALHSSLSGSYSYYMNVADSSVDIIKQQILTNTFYDATQDTAIATASAMTEAGAKMNYGVLYNVAQNTVPKLRNVIEIILYAVFPIVLIMMIVGGTKGFVVVKSYLIGLLWIQLWAPLYAVMNYLISSYNAKEITAIVSAGQELGARHSAELQAQIYSNADIAGMLAMAIPMIAYAIVKGGEMAMTSFVSGATRPVEQNAGMSSREVANGNISLGNSSMDNKSYDTMNAHKYDTTPITANGANQMTNQSGHTITTTGSGQQYHDSTGAQNKGAFHNLQSSLAEKNSYSRDYENSMKTAQKSSMNAAFETGSSFANAGLLSKAASGGSEWSEAFGNKYSHGAQQAFKTMNETANSLEAGGKVQQGEGAELMASMAGMVKAGISLDAGALAEFKAGAGKKFSSQAIAEAAESIKGVDKNDVSSAATIMTEASENDNFQKKVGLSNEARTELKAGNERSEKYSEESRTELEKADSLKTKIASSEERVVTAMADIGAATPYSSLSDKGKEFVSGRGSEMLGLAMEARNNGNMKGYQDRMDEFYSGLNSYQSENGATPTGKNVPTSDSIPTEKDIQKQYDNNQSETLSKRADNQTLVKPDVVMNQVEQQQGQVAGQVADGEKWTKDQNDVLHKPATQSEANMVEADVNAGRTVLQGNHQVGDLNQISIDQNGHLDVQNSQMMDVLGSGKNAIINNAENQGTFAKEAAEKVFSKLEEQADSNPNHTAPGAGVPGAYINSYQSQKVDSSGDVPTITPINQPTTVNQEQTTATSNPVPTNQPTAVNQEQTTATSNPVPTNQPTTVNQEQTTATSNPVPTNQPTAVNQEQTTATSNPVPTNQPTAVNQEQGGIDLKPNLDLTPKGSGSKENQVPELPKREGSVEPTK